MTASTPDGSGAPTADQTDRVVLRTAESEAGGPGCPCDVIVVDDATGALTAHSLQALAEHEGARVFSWSSSCARAREIAEQFTREIADGRLVVPSGARTAPGGAAPASDPALEPVPLEEFASSADAHLALGRLPKSFAGLEDRARRLALAAGGSGRDDLELVAGGRVKHMTRQQNEVLGRVFTEVRASLGLGKSRALIATGPRPGPDLMQPAEGTAAITIRGQAHELPLRGIGGVFGGASADAGSLLLLQSLDEALAAGEFDTEGARSDGSLPGPHVTGQADPAVGSGYCAVDLGCGNGLLTAYLTLALPGARVIASDDDLDAVLSTRATLDALASQAARDGSAPAGGADVDGPAPAPRVEVMWDDALSRHADHSADLVLLNPPFHDGTAIDATLVHGLLDAAARVLRPGGELWMVHNSHLRYRAELERRVGPARQRARDRRFTVLSAHRV